MLTGQVRVLCRALEAAGDLHRAPGLALYAFHSTSWAVASAGGGLPCGSTRCLELCLAILSLTQFLLVQTLLTLATSSQEI